MQPWLLTPSSPHLKPGKRLWKLRLFKTSGCQKKGPNAACHFLPLGFPILPCFCLELPGAHHGLARWRVYPFRMETSEQEKSPPPGFRNLPRLSIFATWPGFCRFRLSIRLARSFKVAVTFCVHPVSGTLKSMALQLAR